MNEIAAVLGIRPLFAEGELDCHTYMPIHLAPPDAEPADCSTCGAPAGIELDCCGICGAGAADHPADAFDEEEPG